MTTAPHAFRRQVEKKKADVPPPTVAFNLDWVDDEDLEKVIRSDTFHATRPSDERMFLLAAMAGDDDANVAEEAAALMDIFRAALPEEEFKVLRSRLRDPKDDVTVEMLQDVFMWLMGEWSSFPTEPSSDSSESPQSTGARSTGRARGEGSIRSTSD